MAGSSINLGLPSIPETQDTELFYELVKVYNALNILAQGTDTASNTASTAGITRGAKAVSTGTNTITFVANEAIVVSSTGNSASIKVTNLNLSCNISTVGAGGMDTGTISTGFVALYIVYNPITKTSYLLAQNTTGVAATSTYTGANIPAGCSYSGLVGIFPISALSTFAVCSLVNRTVNIQDTQVANITTAIAGITALSVTATIPLNTIAVSGSLTLTPAGAGNTVLAVYADVNGNGKQWVEVQIVAPLFQVNAYQIAVYTPGNIYYNTPGIAPSSAKISISAYTF